VKINTNSEALVMLFSNQIKSIRIVKTDRQVVIFVVVVFSFISFK